MLRTALCATLALVLALPGFAAADHGGDHARSEVALDHWHYGPARTCGYAATGVALDELEDGTYRLRIGYGAPYMPAGLTCPLPGSTTSMVLQRDPWREWRTHQHARVDACISQEIETRHSGVLGLGDPPFLSIELIQWDSCRGVATMDTLVLALLANDA